MLVRALFISVVYFAAFETSAEPETGLLKTYVGDKNYNRPTDTKTTYKENEGVKELMKELQLLKQQIDTVPEVDVYKKLQIPRNNSSDQRNGFEQLQFWDDSPNTLSYLISRSETETPALHKIHFDPIYDIFVKRNFDPIDRVSFDSLRKKNFDTIDRSGFGSFVKKNFDSIDSSGFGSFVKKNIDSIDSSGFNSFLKRNFDPIDRSGFSGFSKKNIDPIDSSGFSSFTKKRFNPIDGSGFRILSKNYVKKNLDPIDRSGFGGFVKRNFDTIDRAGFDSFVKKRSRPLLEKNSAGYRK